MWIDKQATLTEMEGGCEPIEEKRETIVQKKLKLLMEQNNVTGYEIAKHIDASEQAVYAWVKGDYEPKRPSVEQLADYFKVPVTFFYVD